MNHDMVLAALGRPEHKVRERTPSGDETLEDWIYGSPPARTTFVTFAGDKVIKVEQFNRSLGSSRPDNSKFESSNKPFARVKPASSCAIIGRIVSVDK